MVLAERATFYARKGFAIFPLHTVDGGRCSCGVAACGSPGKHPVGSLVPHGVSDAQADETAAAEWWAVFPDANIGVGTGDISQIVVLDLDAAREGVQTLDNLMVIHGTLPPTWTVRTGGGGFHHWFRMPPDVRNSASAIGPGIDVRGNGGYVVAPPSRHVSGNAYRWDDGMHPSRVGLADVPDWLVRKMVPGGALRAAQAQLPRTITEGMRNTWMASAAGTMRRRGFCEDAILSALSVENLKRCDPPLDARELGRIARSIERYTPAPTVSVGKRMVGD